MGGVGRKIGIRLAGERKAPSAATLVEQHDPVGIRVKIAPPPGAAPAAWPAVQHHRRLANRIAALLPVDLVSVADGEHPTLVRFNGRVQCHRLISPESKCASTPSEMQRTVCARIPASL